VTEDFGQNSRPNSGSRGEHLHAQSEPEEGREAGSCGALAPADQQESQSGCRRIYEFIPTPFRSIIDDFMAGPHEELDWPASIMMNEGCHRSTKHGGPCRIGTRGLSQC
jgi:hypothetical protein